MTVIKTDLLTALELFNILVTLSFSLFYRFRYKNFVNKLGSFSVCCFFESFDFLLILPVLVFRMFGLFVYQMDEVGNGADNGSL